MRPSLAHAVLALVLAPVALAASGTPAPFEAVCLVTNTGSQDATPAARSTDPADVLLGRTSDPGLGTHVAYFGARSPYLGLRVALSVPGSTARENVVGIEDTGAADFAAFVWPGRWQEVPVLDGTDHFRASGDITFKPPPDWIGRVTDASCMPLGLFYLRMSWARPHVTPPLAAQVLAIR